MAAGRTNYIVVYESDSQVYGAASRDVALKSPPPVGTPIEEKHILFITYQPDNKVLSVHELPHEEVMNAELEQPKPKKAKQNE